MIFLSHTYTDKGIVDGIASTLKQIHNQAKVFYDSWSIQPGDGIIDKMNVGLENCEYFFLFVSKNSLQSNMVKLEWQNALYKSTKNKVKIIPVKIDDCIMPAILLQNLYIDIFSQGIDVATRQIIDVISGKEIYWPEQIFHNIQAYVTEEQSKILIEFKAKAYMEPQSSYLILLNNSKEELTYSAVGESSYFSDFLDCVPLNDGRKYPALAIGRYTATTPNFPFIVEILAKESAKINIMGVMRQINRKKYSMIPSEKNTISTKSEEHA